MKLGDKDRYQELTLLRKSKTRCPHSPDASILETFENRNPDRDYRITFHCPEFTALCPVTGQPDFGRIEIHYIPNRRCVESKSLKIYLFSYRNHNTFHEDAVNTILTDVVKACAPRWAEVVGDFHPRGGISISVRASTDQETRRRPSAKKA